MKTGEFFKNTTFEKIVKSRFYQFARQHKNPLINLLYNQRLERILNMVDCVTKEKKSSCIALDVGCGHASLSQVLSLRFTTIGLDIDRSQLQKKDSRLNLIVADMAFLPFRNHSVDIVVCASVLEHAKNLYGLMKEIKRVMKKDTTLVVGYPVETRLFKIVWRIASPWSFRFIDQNQTFWCNPFTGKQECYWESPHTHKQDYIALRSVISRSFSMLKKEKLPLNSFPDLLTYYECIAVRNAPKGSRA